jgi:acyl carrier protein
MPGPAPTAQQAAPIKQFLIERIAYYLECPVDDVDPTVPLAETGMDSVSGTSLCGDVEDRFDINVDPTLVYEYPTVDDIVGFIWAETSGGE